MRTAVQTLAAEQTPKSWEFPDKNKATHTQGVTHAFQTHAPTKAQ